MNEYFMIGFLLGMFNDFLCYLIVIPTKRKWRRECNYDCSKCKVFDCERFACMRQMKKDKKNYKI